MVTGATHIYSVALNDGKTHIANARADGALLATPKQLELHGLRYSGLANGVQIDGHVAVASLLHGHDLDLHTVDTFALGGTFHGDALLRNFEIFTANGTVAGLDIRRTVGLFSPEPLPWDGLVSGNAGIEASLKHSDQLTISGALDVSPAAEGAPVHGKIEGSYNAAGDTFAVSNSTLTLPHSRGDFSGALGRSLRAHLETTDLNDFLPIFGKNAQSLPVKLANGSLSFDGTATGNIDSIEAVGHLTAMRLQYEKESVDSLTADVTASPSGVQFRNAVATRGALRAQFNVTAALNKWETEPTGAIAGAATLHNAAIPDVVSALQLGAVPVSGALDVSAQVSGTFGDPKAAADLVVAKGSIQDEPFDRFSAHLAYGGRTIDLSGGQLDAGPKRVTLAASYEHTPDRFDSGLVRFHIATNSMALAQIRTVQNERPGAEGNFQLEANGVVDVAAPPAGELTLRVQDLSANITALGLHLGQQPFGDVRVTASSQSGVLQAHLESNFADSNIRGDGQWQLTGDYPGSANINFSRLDFARLNSWLSPGASETPDFTGAAEGSLRIEGAARKPKTLTAEVTIPKFQIAPAHSPTQDGQFALTNAAPIVARLANSVVTVQSAHFTGPSSDISLTGRATLEPKVALDLRASGHLDLGLVHELNRDFIASGTITTDATIRGDFSTPQINGRVQFQNAGLNVAGFSNGISNAAGSIIFAGDRATIQEFTGETGGGKIELTGFATYASGESVFRVHARASQVRVRKPEGVSTVADADLTLSGTVQRSLLSGSISIRRMAFNQESDFSSILTASAQPVETPAAQTGFLGGLGLDVQISSAPDIQVQSSLTQAVQVEANLRLRGTITNPALLGRVNITQGQLTFFGTKYQVSDGSISFYNPSKIAPVFDVDLTTKAQGIEITLTISGPLDHLTLTPSSDSSLNYNDIISLLVTGRPPTSDPALLSGQNALGPGAFQQMGASALLGQAIAAPVTGRLQRFFGVSSLRIDPTIPGIDANPAARLTLQQQVTPNITFTYITSVTTTNPQIVQVEWALNSRWSVVALREENGETGLDFYFKKKF
jgi:translocation and assembly module TamB